VHNQVADVVDHAGTLSRSALELLLSRIEAALGVEEPSNNLVERTGEPPSIK
jgi:hypothetical protein